MKTKKGSLIVGAILGMGCALIVSGLALAGSDPLPTQGGGILTTSGAPSNGVSEVQTFTLNTGTSPVTVKFAYKGSSKTMTLTGTESNANITTLVNASLGSLITTGTANLSVATTGSTSRVITATYQGGLARLSVPQATSTVTSSGTVTCTAATSTAGVTADGRSAPTGQLLIDVTNGVLYVNKGAPPLQDWEPVGNGATTLTLGNGIQIITGTFASPTSNVSAIPGSLYLGTSGTSNYLKTSGTDATGWHPITTGTGL